MNPIKHPIIVTLLCLISCLAFGQNPQETMDLDRALILVQHRHYDSAEIVISQSLPIIMNSNDDLIKAKAFAVLHDLQWHKSNFDSALAMIDQSVSLLQNLNQYEWLGFCLNNRGKDYLILGNYEKSIADYQKAAKLYHENGDTLNWANSLSYLSNVNHDIFEFEKGIEYGLQALDLLKSIAEYDPDKMAYAINCIAINHDDKGEHQKAIDFHMMAIEIIPDMKNQYNIHTYNNIGNSLMKLGRYDEAIGWLKKHLELAERLNRKYGIATVKTNLGTLSYLNHQFENSKTYLDQAELIAFEINDVEKIHDVLFQQYKLYQTWGKYEHSLGYLEKFHFFKDSLLNETKTRQLAEIQTKYETELKEKEIETQKAQLAQKDITLQRNQVLTTSLGGILILLITIGFLQRNRMLLKQKTLLEAEKAKTREAQIEAALNSQETERKRFARDLHDSFGQMISVLNLNLKALEKGGTDTHEIFDASAKVLDEMYKELKGICFNLMPETLIKQGVVDAIKEFSMRINRSGNLLVEVDTFGIDQRLSDLQEISVYRITQEWVNNIIKHSNARKITISLTKDDEELTLLIEDDGSGFDQTLLENGSGNGWKNLNSRANLIKGTLELDTKPGIKGSTLIVNAPIPIISSHSEKPQVEIPL